MKAPTASALLSIAAWSACAHAAVTMNIRKNPDAQPKIRRRHLQARASSTITESLVNNATGGDYIAQITVGTPPQTQQLLIDTGSSDVWMLAATADLCTDPALQNYYGLGPCTSTFNQAKSSSYKVVVAGGFDITYNDNSGAEGDYITDTLTIGGVTIKTLEMGLAFNASSSIGVMGIGYDADEASDEPTSTNPNDPFASVNPGFIYPNIIDTMVNEGLINTKAYSLYLDDLQASTGSIIFGGLDADKYHGSLLQMPVVPDTLENGTNVYADLSVALTGYGITSQSGTTTNLTTSSYEEVVVLDSGTTITYLPTRLVALIVQQIGAFDDTGRDGTGYIFVDCAMANNNSMTFNYGFGGANGVSIKVPANELVLPLDGIFPVDGSGTPNTGFSSNCILGMAAQTDPPYVLGDTFLRSAYVIYDLKNNLIAIAQTNFNSTTSSIVEFQASATSIPDVSGVASSATVSQTVTGVIGNGGVPKTSGGTTSTGAASTATKSKSAGATSVPAFDGKGLIVLCISSAFALMGGGLLLA